MKIEHEVKIVQSEQPDGKQPTMELLVCAVMWTNCAYFSRYEKEEEVQKEGGLSKSGSSLSFQPSALISPTKSYTPGKSQQLQNPLTGEGSSTQHIYLFHPEPIPSPLTQQMGTIILSDREHLESLQQSHFGENRVLNCGSRCQMVNTPQREYIPF